MSQTQPDILLRYLHERDALSFRERFIVEWQLLTSRSSRDTYTEMGRMHRALSLHFAPNAAAGLPVPCFLWLRIGIFALIGATVAAGLLLGIQERYQSRQANAVALSAKGYCSHCHKPVSQCSHCRRVVSPLGKRCSH